MMSCHVLINKKKCENASNIAQFTPHPKKFADAKNFV